MAEPDIKPPRVIWDKPEPDYSERLKRRTDQSTILALKTIRETKP